MKRILIMAGGTGGHVIPALAVAKSLQQNDVEVHWLGTQNGIENQLVPAANIPLHHISVQGVRGKGIKGIFAAPFRITRAILQASRLIKTLKPDSVLGMGGFASGPGGLAAWMLRKPLIIHEQNAIAGMTNRWLAKLATQVFQAFPNTFPIKYKAVTTGNPVRMEIIQLPMPAQRLTGRQGRLNLLVLGGSQGAAVFNQTLPAAIKALPADLQPDVWHSAGSRYIEETQKAYAQYNLSARIDGFIADMAGAYTWADIVLCRSGALTGS